jgi:hypothetical protein
MMKLRHVFVTLMLLGEITIRAGLTTAWAARHAHELEVIRRPPGFATLLLRPPCERR